MSDEHYQQQLLAALEIRVLSLERHVFGRGQDEITSKIQQQRKIPDELIQINSQINRAVSNRECISKLMNQIEKLLQLLALEESGDLMGLEVKANAIVAAEPFIRRAHALVQQINLDKVHEALNSEAIRGLSSLRSQLSKLRSTQSEQEVTYEEFTGRIKSIEEAISILLSGFEYV